MDAAERRVSRTMRAQLGLIQRSQALALGMTRGQIEYRLTSRRWEAVHPGTYRSAEGPASPEQLLLAACLTAGPDAVASHLSAAWMWDLVRRSPPAPQLSVPYPLQPRLHGVAVRRCRDLDPGRTIVRRGIPCTDPVRVLGDVAAVLPGDELAGIVDGAVGRGLVSPEALVQEIDRRRRPGQPGPAALRRMLAGRGMVGGPPPSVLEVEAMRLFRRWGIPVLGREVSYGPHAQYRIDFLIAPGLAVEVDGFAHHWSPEAKARDEARRNQLRLNGLFILVYTWTDIRGDGRRVAAEITRALRQQQHAAAAI